MSKTVHELIVQNRSYRGFDESREITQEEMRYFIDCARLSASSVNKQPLKYLPLYKKDDTDRMLPLTRWARGLPDMKLPHDGMAPTGYIVICLDLNIADGENAFPKDIGIVAQSILLAATEKGLGGCMIGNFTPSEVKEAFCLDEKLSPKLVVALGKPAEKIVLTEIESGEGTNYYRDENDVHYVPKRKLEDVIINAGR